MNCLRGRAAHSTIRDRAGEGDNLIPYPVEAADRNLKALLALAAPIRFLSALWAGSEIAASG